MGNHQSRPGAEHERDYLDIKRTPGKRSSVNLLKKIDSRQGSLSRLSRVQSSLTRRQLPFGAAPVTQGFSRHPSQKETPDSPASSQKSVKPRSDSGIVPVEAVSRSSLPLPRDTTSSTLIPGKSGQPAVLPPDDSSSVYDVRSDDHATPVASPITSMHLESGSGPSMSDSVTDDDVDGDETLRAVHRRTKTLDPEQSKENRETHIFSDPPRLQTMPSVSAPNLLMADFSHPNISLMYDSPAKPYRPASKLAPPYFFHQARRVPHPHAPRLIKSLEPRVQRLVQQRYPLNLVREVDPLDRLKPDIALAMPLSRAQADCHGQHTYWLPSDNTISPVECAVCLGPRDVASDPSTALYWVCEHCAVRVCTSCKKAWEESGKMGMMKRYDDGTASVCEKAANGSAETKSE